MDFLSNKYFWIIVISAIAIVIIASILKNKSTNNVVLQTANAGAGCPSSSGLDKFGNPCPSKGTGCPNIKDTDFYGNPCPPDCFNGCRSSQPGYDCDGNFSANC